MLSQRLRIMFALLGLALVGLSIMALVYVQQPHKIEMLREPVEPTMFVAPQ